MMKKFYTLEIEFEDEITLAEQDRRVCMVLENLVTDWWPVAAIRAVPHGIVPVPDSAIATPASAPARR